MRWWFGQLDAKPVPVAADIITAIPITIGPQHRIHCPVEIGGGGSRSGNCQRGIGCIIQFLMRCLRAIAGMANGKIAVKI